MQGQRLVEGGRRAPLRRRRCALPSGAGRALMLSIHFDSRSLCPAPVRPLQAMLPVNTIALLQSTLLAPATPLGGSDAGTAVRANSDPLDASRVASLDAANEAALMGMVRSSLPVAGAASVYQAMMAPQGQVGWWGASVGGGLAS